jgi:hypothetical protein
MFADTETVVETMTDEECALAERALRGKGYKRFFRISYGNGRYWLRARKHEPLSEKGLFESCIELRKPEDLKAFL